MFTSITPHKELEMHTREVVVEMKEYPQLMVEVKITGSYFPHRGAEPFVRIILSDDDKKMLPSSWTDVADDNLALLGYFPVALPERGEVEFGYGDRVMGRVPLPFELNKVKVLDRRKLPDDIVIKLKHPGLLDRTTGRPDGG